MEILLGKLRPRLLILSVLLTTCATLSQSQPYVILISFDGFRWDYVDRGISPNIDLLIKDGVKAASLQPVFPTKTFPNHISIITGMYPVNHGIIFNNFNDPYSSRFYEISDTIEVRESRWYKGEAFWETATRQGIITASYFWPSSDINLDYKDPNLFHHYEHTRPYSMRVEGILKWLNLPYNERPHFITLYFDLADGIGHNNGPDSPEINLAISTLDSTLDKLISGIEEIGLRDSVNIILVSDHGMTKVTSDKLINVEEILNGYTPKYSNNGPVMMVSPSKNDIEKIYSILKKHKTNYKVYKREDIPSYYHFSKNPMISELVLTADLGWSLITNNDLKWMKLERFNGNHGYDNHHIDMHGVFIAEGPLFKNNYKTGTLNCLDVYPLLCKIFNVIPAGNIDGHLDRIGFILKEDKQLH